MKPVATTLRPPVAGFRAGLALVVGALSCLSGGCGIPARARELFAPDSAPVPSLPSVETRAELVRVLNLPEEGDEEGREIELLVHLPAFGITGIRAARVIVRSAVDEFGTDLVPRKPPPGRPLARSVAPGGGVLVPLRPPSAAATHLPEVSVEVQLDATGNEPSSLVTLPRFLDDAGAPVESPVLAGAGVGLGILTPEQVEAGRAAAAANRRAEGEEKGLGGGLLEASIWLASGKPFAAGEGEVVLKVSDPNSRVREFGFLDGSGRARATRREERGEFSVLSCEGGSPGPGWSLQVHLQAPKTLRRYRFTLRNVPLR